MIRIHHLNCGWLHKPPGPRASCHCLLLESSGELILVDSGIGLRDIADPFERIGQESVEAAGFQFNEDNTAFRQIVRLGLDPSRVRNIVLTHADPDHVGGLTDFPMAAVHVYGYELANIARKNPRYSLPQFFHDPNWRAYSNEKENWFGMDSTIVRLPNDIEVRLIQLNGHTVGHCGVAIPQDSGWFLHAGDAYYLRGELETDVHSVSPLAELRADDNAMRMESLDHLKRLHTEHANEVTMIGYHDASEFLITS